MRRAKIYALEAFIYMAHRASKVADIISASFNFNILDIWTQGRDDVGNLNGVGPVLFSEGAGRKSFDITDGFKTSFANAPLTAIYYFSYTGYSGFTFASAEGGDPAYLRITTIAAAVPEPETYVMLLAGLGLVGFVARRRKHNLM
ncbi:MAG: FxDxF family PEP-CTERM protein [Methylotenera sp.]